MASPPLRQAEINECGLVAIAMAAEFLGARHSLPQLRARFPLSSRGASLADLSEIAEGLSLRPSLISCRADQLAAVHTPAILHWRTGHFVVLTKVRGARYHIQDPERGESELDLASLTSRFSGAAMELRKAEAFQRIRPKTAFKLDQLFRLDRPILSGLGQALVLTALMQVHIIVAPLFIRVVIDDLLQGMGNGGVEITAVAFAAFALFNLAAELLRTTALIRVAAVMSMDATSRVFAHLTSLPLAWFQRRKLADVIARFDAIEPINTTITSGLVMAGFDVLIALTTLVFMIATSPRLALVAIGGTALYVLIRVATVPVSMKLDAQGWSTAVAEQGARIETLRTIQTIKGTGSEAARLRTWSKTFADRMVAAQNARLWKGGLQAVQTTVQTLTYIALVFVAVGQIGNGAMSLGVLFAFLAYSTQFSLRSKAIVDQAVQFRLLGLHTDRISEIVQSEPEQRKSADHIRRSVVGEIRGTGITFQYGQGDPLVLNGTSFCIRPGDIVGIVGPSGGGKSTLVKIIAGLYVPRVGVLDVDGEPIHKWDYQALRRQIGMVLQGDELFSGSIEDNITLFTPASDGARVQECLRLAAFDRDVAALPLGLHTPVGDLGSNLSGGQRQRVLIARALYQDPPVIILDEATSNLDVQTEQQIVANLIALRRTLIMVSHRSETMRLMRRIITVRNGLVSEEPVIKPVLATN